LGGGVRYPDDRGRAAARAERLDDRGHPALFAPATATSTAPVEFSTRTASGCPSVVALSGTASGWLDGTRQRVCREMASLPTAASSAWLRTAWS